jgi:hypothetical protein
LEEKRERIERREGLGGKKERLGGFWPNSHLLPPPLIQTEKGRGAALDGRPAAIGGGPGHGGGYEVGKMKRGSRATYPFPHLGRR